MNRIAIRRENKNHWEKRVPLVPSHIVELVAEDVPIAVQPSDVRAFADEAYATAGATVREDIDKADVIFGVKEVPSEYFTRPAAWMYFSHTIKGQPQNMPALKSLMDSGSTLFDYELITNDDGQRLVFFGRHAGYAGIIETLVALSRRWEKRGFTSPLSELRQPYEYTNLAELSTVLEHIGERIRSEGLPKELPPLRIAIMGAGNVSQGAQHLLNMLPTFWYEPEDFLMLQDQYVKGLGNGDDLSRHLIHATVLREHDMVTPLEEGRLFDLEHFYAHPEEYRPMVKRFLKASSAAVTTYYWDERYPRYITNQDLKELSQQEDFSLEVIGDITCDIEGSVEPTIRPTDPGEPCYTFDPVSGEYSDGIQTEGIVIMAVDNLPCELSVDASDHFSQALHPFVKPLATANFAAPTVEESGLPKILQRACIVWRGQLTDAFKELQTPLSQYGTQ